MLTHGTNFEINPISAVHKLISVWWFSIWQESNGCMIYRITNIGWSLGAWNWFGSEIYC